MNFQEDEDEIMEGFASLSESKDWLNESGEHHSVENNEQLVYDWSDDSDTSDLSLETLDDCDDDNRAALIVGNSEVDKCSISTTSQEMGSSPTTSSPRKINEIVQYKDLANIMQTFSQVPSLQYQELMKKCQSYFHFQLSKEQEDVLKRKVQTFKAHYHTKWTKWNRHIHRFELNEQEWLNSYLLVPENFFLDLSKHNSNKKSKRSKMSSELKSEPLNVPGQRSEFLNLSQSGQKKAVQKVTQTLSVLPTPVLLHSTRQILSKRNDKATSLILKEIQKSPDRAAIVLSKIRAPEIIIKPFTPDEALAVLIQLRLSVFSYKFLRNQTENRKTNLFPSYQKITKSKKECYPRNMTVQENCAKVPLQELLRHTTERIAQSHRDPILAHVASDNNLELILVGIYGFDGSLGHSMYNQNFSKNLAISTEQHLFATTFTPMRLLTNRGFVLWQNSVPQSIRFCRPLKLEYIKETSEQIEKERNKIAAEIEKLSRVEVALDRHILIVTFDLRLTAIDGKALQVITGVTKSSQSCPLCGAKPSSFSDLSNLQNDNFLAKPEVLVYGISPLHSWIRLFEFCLKLAYRNPAKAYPVKTKSDKKSYADAKKKIQENLRREMGILVDVVKQGCGTTNNGNMARKAFQNHQKFATILRIDKQFVRRLHIILVTMSSQFSIKAQEFGEFCLETLKYYISQYPWNPPSSTLHKVLVHVEAIIENSILPLGLMGEDGAESRNRFYRHDRQFHARQMNRLDNMRDLFPRALVSSDPVISSFFMDSRRNQRK